MPGVRGPNIPEAEKAEMMRLSLPFLQRMRYGQDAADKLHAKEEFFLILQQNGYDRHYENARAVGQRMLSNTERWLKPKQKLGGPAFTPLMAQYWNTYHGLNEEPAEEEVADEDDESAESEPEEADHSTEQLLPSSSQATEKQVDDSSSTEKQKPQEEEIIVNVVGVGLEEEADEADRSGETIPADIEPDGVTMAEAEESTASNKAAAAAAAGLDDATNATSEPINKLINEAGQQPSCPSTNFDELEQMFVPQPLAIETPLLQSADASKMSVPEDNKTTAPASNASASSAADTSTTSDLTEPVKKKMKKLEHAKKRRRAISPSPPPHQPAPFMTIQTRNDQQISVAVPASKDKTEREAQWRNQLSAIFETLQMGNSVPSRDVFTTAIDANFKIELQLKQAEQLWLHHQRQQQTASSSSSTMKSAIASLKGTAIASLTTETASKARKPFQSITAGMNFNRKRARSTAPSSRSRNASRSRSRSRSRSVNREQQPQETQQPLPKPGTQLYQLAERMALEMVVQNHEAQQARAKQTVKTEGRSLTWRSQKARVLPIEPPIVQPTIVQPTMKQQQQLQGHSSDEDDLNENEQERPKGKKELATMRAPRYPKRSPSPDEQGSWVVDPLDPPLYQRTDDDDASSGSSPSSGLDPNRYRTLRDSLDLINRPLHIADPELDDDDDEAREGN